MSIYRLLEQFLADLRFGLRNLAKTRSFTAIAIGSLALGIGGSTAMYSVIYAVILDPFPYKDAGRLMSVTVQGQRGGNGSYYPIDQFLDIAEKNTVFSGVIASTWSDVTWTGQGEPQRLRGNHCTMNTFDVMGVPALIGRTTTAQDEAEGAEPVTVLGYKFWQRQFGGDPGVIGRKLRLNDKLRTVIGVMPMRFMWRGADVYLPDVFHRGQTVEGERAVHLLARLKPGVHARAGGRRVAAGLPGHRTPRPRRVPEGMDAAAADFRRDLPKRHSGCALDSVRRGGIAAADLLRQRLEPPALARGLPAPRNGSPRRHRRAAIPNHPPVAGGKPAAGNRRRSAGRSDWSRGIARNHRDGAAQYDSRRSAHHAQCAGAAVHARRFDSGGAAVRPGPGAASFGPRISSRRSKRQAAARSAGHASACSAAVWWWAKSRSP